MTKYVEINLDTAEVIRQSAEHGEKIDPKTGAIVAPLPAMQKPCDGDPDEKGRHDRECICHGTGVLVIHRPRIDPVDTVDDSLTALEDALAQRDARVPKDTYLGASPEDLLQPDYEIAGTGGSKSGRKREKPAKRVDADPHPSVEDGRLERRGRKPRFSEKREDRSRVTVAPETANLLDAKKDDLAKLADEILAMPECAAVLAEVKAAKR